jgi:putative GTP pyrophosphokinase
MPDSTTEPLEQRVDRILAEHREKLAIFEDFAETCKELIERLLRGQGVRVHSVTCRAKTCDSLRQKLTAAGKDYAALTEVTDLVGIRIITYLADDVDAIGTIVEREFTVIAEESIDKRKVLDPDRFGYLSLHYVCMLSDARAQLAEYATYKPYKLEIQVRSILQHAWAEIEHDLGYKAPEGIPRQIRRRFSRLAGLLETADEEFMRIRDELAAYASAVRTEIAQESSQVLLDKVSLTTFMERDAAVRRIDQELARHAGARLTPPARVESDVQYLRYLGMETIDQVRAALLAKEPIIVRQFQIRVKPGEYKSLNRGISVFHLWQVLLCKKGGVAEVVAAFDRFHIDLDETREDGAREIVEAVRKACRE